MRESRTNDIPFVRATEIGLHELLVHALAGVVVGGVGVIIAVEKNDAEGTVRGDFSLVVRQAAGQFVANERVAIFVEAGAEHNLIEIVRLGQGK